MRCGAALRVPITVRVDRPGRAGSMQDVPRRLGRQKRRFGGMPTALAARRVPHAKTGFHHVPRADTGSAAGLKG